MNPNGYIVAAHQAPPQSPDQGTRRELQRMLNELPAIR